MSKGNGHVTVDRRLLRETAALEEDAREKRLIREGPSHHWAENRSSRARKMRQPHDLSEYLVWFLDGWSAEVPEEMHLIAGVWRAQPPRVDAKGEPTETVKPEEMGGSLLGSPRDAEPFRQLMENSARQVATEAPADYDGPASPYFVRPMRAALERMAGNGAPDRPSPLMARFLRQVASAGGDYAGVAVRWNIFPVQVCQPPACDAAGHRHQMSGIAAETFTRVALERLWHAWEAEPMASPKDAA